MWPNPINIATRRVAEVILHISLASFTHGRVGFSSEPAGGHVTRSRPTKLGGKRDDGRLYMLVVHGDEISWTRVSAWAIGLTDVFGSVSSA
jgi:hypothetical protein